jgi:hypothetical protein
MVLFIVFLLITLCGLLLCRIYLFLFYNIYSRFVFRTRNSGVELAMFPKYFRQSIGSLGTLILVLPPIIAVMPSVNELFFDTMRGPIAFIKYIMSDGRFDRSLAGFVMDRPTIGKWLFWFTVETMWSIPYMAIVAWVSNRKKMSTHIVYCFAAIFICGVLLCTLMLPAKWLVQYVHDMGYTPTRIFGLIYCIVSGVFVLGFLWWLGRQPKVKGGV